MAWPGSNSTGGRLIVEEIAAFESKSLADVRLIGYADDEVETIRSVARGFGEYVELEGR